MDVCKFLENVITVHLNGRGSGSRGDDFLFELYRRIGQLEPEDQVIGVQYVVNFVSLLTHHQEVFTKFLLV